MISTVKKDGEGGGVAIKGTRRSNTLPFRNLNQSLFDSL